jgi:hypothetical protein
VPRDGLGGHGLMRVTPSGSRLLTCGNTVSGEMGTGRLTAEEANSRMRGRGGRPEPDLLGSLLKDLRIISDQIRAALSGHPAKLHSGPAPAPVRRQDHRRRREHQ